MGENCPVGCQHCAEDSAEELEARNKYLLEQEEFNVDFADQDD